MALLPNIITAIFLVVVLSYYVLLFWPRRRSKRSKRFSSVTIIIPAHNEERYIDECIRSVIAARFNGKKEIIVVDDGSKDSTAKIAKKYPVTLIRSKHQGKSASMNMALSQAKGELIMIVDADGIIGEDSLEHMARELGRAGVGAAACPIRVHNRKFWIMMWVHIEQLYNSLMRAIMSKLNANIATPGPLSGYRKTALDKVGGFSTEGFSEDLDITIRLIRAGYKVGFAEKAWAETNMPEQIKWFLLQRMRFARGMINIFKRHLQAHKTFIDIYSLPILLFTYIQAIIMGSFTMYQIISGYITWFASKGIYFSTDVLRYFLDWTSIIGFINWVMGIFSGTSPLTTISIIGILSTLLSYPLYFIAIFRYDKLDIWHIIPLFFMAPFWWFIMIIYIFMLPEVFRKHQYNRWLKND